MDPYEHNNETLGSIKCKKFLAQQFVPSLKSLRAFQLNSVCGTVIIIRVFTVIPALLTRVVS
jgi:hypothetical protein